MGRRAKAGQPSAMIRRVVADNVKELRDKWFASLPNETQRNKAIAKEMETTLSQVQRIVNGTVGLSIDQVELLAKVLRCRPQDLLTPYFGQSVS
jgi:hypothetical protein